MKPILCFGEALIDFLNVSTDNSGTVGISNYQQFPGGAPANAAVAVSKLGGNAYFAGQVGNDQFGQFLLDALNTYQVNTEFVVKHPTAPTALAFVILDETGDRSFSFYRNSTADTLVTREQVLTKWFDNNPIVHMCSNTLTDPDIADTTLYVAEKCHQLGGTLSIDVNLRHNLWPSGSADKMRVNQLVAQASVLKFSLDELLYLSGGQAESYLQTCLAHKAKVVVITDGANDIQVLTPELKLAITPPNVKAIDTTAGGDGFIGGLLFVLSQLADLNIVLNDADVLAEVVQVASFCGALTVTRKGAFPALPLLEEVIIAMNVANKKLSTLSFLTKLPG